MKKKILLAGLLCGTIFSPGWTRPLSPPIRVAQQNSDTSTFLNSLAQALAKQDEKEVVRILQTQPELAKSTFHELLRKYPELTDPQQKEAARAVLLVIAAYFEGVGQPELTAALKKAHLQVPKEVAEPAGWEALFAAYPAEMRMALSVGNFRAAERIHQNLQSMFKIVPFSKEQLAGFKLIGEMAAVFNNTYGGRPVAAIGQWKVLMPVLAQDPEAELIGRISLAAAGREAARPDVVDSQLPRILELEAQSKSASLPLFRYVTDSYSLERELQRGAKFDRHTLVTRFQQSFAGTGGYHVGAQSQMEGRLFWGASRIWAKAAGSLVSWIENDKADDELGELVVTIINTGQRLLQEMVARPATERNAEFLTGLCDYILDVAQSAREHQNLKDGRKILTDLDPILDASAAAWTATEKEDIGRIRQYGKRNRAELDQARKAGLKIDLAVLEVPLLQGDLSRVMARRDVLWMSQLQAEMAQSGKTDTRVLEQRLTSAEARQAEARKGQGYSGMEDVRWLRLQTLWAQKPAGWEKRADSLVKQMVELNNRLSYGPGQIAALTYDGELKVVQNQKASAIQSLQKAVDLAESYISQMGGDAAAAARIRSEYKRAYDTLAKLQLEAGKGPEAFDTLSRLQQLNSVSQASSSLEKGSATISTLRNANESLQQELTARKQTNQDTKPIEELLAQNKAEFHTVLNQIRRDNPRYESVLAIRPVNFSKQQKFIPANAAIVQYFPADDCLYIFVATTTDLKIHKVPVTSAALQKQVMTMRRIGISDFARSLQDGAAAISWKDDSAKALKDSLFQLHKLLIDPVEADVAGKEVLAFIPTGYLDYLPFAALARPDATKGAEFLIERKQCVTLLKSSDLDQLSRGATAGGGGVLALGNPDGSLPGSEKEVNAVTGAISGSQKYLGGEARKERLSPLGPGISYLHLATHGMLDSRDPTASFLVMAGKEEQGKLRVPAIYDLKLDGVRLVTLSACQTALADREPGSELTSLADAFSVAGTNSVVASLWSVSDDSTRALMVDFYAHLKEGKSLSASLQQAEVSLLHNPATTHPFYWAPFTLIGDWR